MGCRLAEMGFNVGNPVLILCRDGEEQGGDARFDIKLESGNDDGHTQRMGPDALATAQHPVTVSLPRILDSRLEAIRFRGLQTHCQRGQELIEIAQCGDRMDDGNHSWNYTAEPIQARRLKSP